MTFLEASRAWLSVHGQLPFRLTVLIEGDEEGDNSPISIVSSPTIARRSAADVAFICDTGMWDQGTPAITTRLRGCIAEEITITGPNKDLHSGYYGGPARNPIRVLTKILADMHDRNGRVAIPGFYDGVGTVPAKTRAAVEEPRLFRSAGFSAMSVLPFRLEKRAIPSMSRSGRARPPSSMASGAAIPATAARRCCPRSPAPR